MMQSKRLEKEQLFMKRSFLMLMICGVFLLLTACAHDSSKPTETIPDGAYHYTGYDQNGAKIVEGWLTLVFENATTVSGKWHLQAIDGSKNIGPQIGVGELGGEIQNGQKLIINLSPTTADNNVYLDGDYTSAGFTGTWNWYTMTGTPGQGTFVATKQ
jgi:hypothetical protein